ncbi:MAG: hypothetical protein RIT34_1773 [Bacteroidota bacterium]|jgi:hypothetical protein
MNRQEALITVGFEASSLPDLEEIQDALETVFFDIKQRLYRSFDQVLLYSKFEKELLRFLKAEQLLLHDQTFELPSKKEPRTSVVFSPFSAAEIDLFALLEQLKMFQKQRAQLQTQLYNCPDASALLLLLEKAKLLFQNWFEIWPRLDLDTEQPVKLSQILDAQALYTELQELVQGAPHIKGIDLAQFKLLLASKPLLLHEILRIGVTREKLQA